nr:unnamed protein product [Callosobruchus analis]
MNKPKQLLKEVVAPNNTLCNTPLSIANTFNDYFVSIGESYAGNIEKPNNHRPQRKINTSTFFLEPVNVREIISIINTLKNKKSPGVDNLKAELFKSVSEIISLPLCHLINRIYTSNEVPEQFKIAVVTPIHKKGDAKNITNYRPISIISTFAKIFEKTLKCRLVKFLDKCNVISEKQFGFREGLSTNDAVAKLTEQIRKSLEMSRPVLSVFLDLAKAFDTVNHQQMLEALEDAGIRGGPRELFASYLSNRKQVSKIGDTLSNERTLSYGLPQGTVLGPILFTVYINNILTSSSCGRVFSFADDTAVLYEDSTWEKLKLKAEHDLGIIFDYFAHKLLTVNYEKTYFMPFANTVRCLPQFEQLSINSGQKNILLASVDSYKYLGVIIDCHLKWDAHICNVTGTLRQLLYRFRYLKHIIDYSNLKILYYSLVESRLRYAILSWGSAATCYMQPLEILQKRIMLAIKVMVNKTITYPSDQLFSDTGLLDVRQIYIHQVILFLYKNMHNFDKVSHVYSTRHRENQSLEIQTLQRNISLRCHSYLSRKIYNHLPHMYRIYLNSINSLSMIKNILKNIFSKLVEKSHESS